VIAFVANRHAEISRLESAELALLLTAIFLPFVQRASQAARTMPLAFGVVTVDAVGALGGFIAVSAVSAWVDGLVPGTETVAIVAVVSFLCVALWDTYVLRLATPRRRVLLVGSAETIAMVVDDLAAGSSPPGFKVVAIATDHQPPKLRRGPWAIGGLSEIEELVTKTRPELIIVATIDNRAGVFARLLEIANAGFSVMGLPEFYEVAFARLPVRQLTPAWFMSTLHFYSRPYNRLVKRGFDIGMALVAMLVAVPVFPVIVILVKRTPGPLFFRQQRLGQYGQPFTIVKFRSMVVAAESDGARWAQARDPRIIRGGGIMRRARLDELPQLWNVLKGEMSFVGPRPERPEFVHELEREVPYWTARNLLKPGITGWAQIRAGYTADGDGAEVKLAYDLWYLRHRSLVLDAVICLKTLTTLVTGAGAR